jgi:hypothetical protein
MILLISEKGKAQVTPITIDLAEASAVDHGTLFHKGEEEAVQCAINESWMVSQM